MKPWILSLLLMAAAAVPAARAEEPAAAPAAANLAAMEAMFLAELPKVMIASAKEENPDLAPANIFVITGEEMVARGYRSLYDLLQDLPGVTVHHQVGDENNGPVVIRGIKDAQRFRLLFNGMPVDPEDGYGLTWDERFPVEGVERVEFILGPYASLYGRNSFSGIMNVVTKTGEQLKGGQVSALYGTWNKTQASAVYGQKVAGFDFMLSLFKNLSTSGRDMTQEYPEIYDRKVREGQVNLADGSQITDGTPLNFDRLNPEWTMPWDATNLYLTLKHDLGLSLDFQLTRMRFAKMGTAFTPWLYLQNQDGMADDQTLNGRLAYAFKVGDFMDSTTSLIFQQYSWYGNNLYNFTYDETGTVLLPNERGEKWYASEHKCYSFKEQLRFKLWDQNDLYAGVQTDTLDRKLNKASNDGSVATSPARPTWGDWEVSRATYLNVTLQDEMRFTDWLKVVAGAMYEKSNTYADVIVPRASIIAALSPSTTAKLIYSGGYINPNPMVAIDQLLPSDSTLGVKDIRPEFMDSLDLTLIQRLGKNNRLSASAYYNRVKDMIQMVIDSNLPSPYTNTWKNIGTTIAKGFELNGDFAVTPELKVFFSYGFVNGQYDAVNPDGTIQVQTRLPLAAIHSLKVGANLALWENKLNLFVHELVIGDRFTYTDRMLAGYTLLNLALTTTPALDKNWYGSAGVKNVLDQKGMDPVRLDDVSVYTDSPIPRRTFDVEVGYRF